MNLKLGLFVIAASFAAAACGGKSSSDGESTKSRRTAESLKGGKGDSKSGQGSQQGNQGSQQDPSKGNPVGLISCELLTDEGMVNCSNLDTVLVPAQEEFSRFEVRYEFSCGNQGAVSPIGLRSDKQYRAFVFGEKNTISLYGQGPLRLDTRGLEESRNAGVDYTGCSLYLEVMNVERALTQDADSPAAPTE